jgi:cytoskeletal protein RodZ
LGEWLRNRREALDISLEEAEEQTRIRARYLEALESEDLQALPNPVVASGFLRNYASYLELDPRQAVERYAAIGGSIQLEPVSVDKSSPFAGGPFEPVALHEMPSQRSRWWLALAVVVILAFAALGLLLWRGYFTFPALNWLSGIVATAQPVATSTQSIAAAATATATQSPRTTPLPTTQSTTATVEPPQPSLEPTTLTTTLTPALTLSPSPPPTATEPVYTGIFLELVFTDTSWIQVSIDGIRQFQGELEAPTYRSWYGDERIELRVGNAGAVEVTVNGQRIGMLGEPDEVVDRIFEIADDGLLAGTPTPEPTVSPGQGTAGTEVATPTFSVTAVTPTETIAPTQAIAPTLSP